ncbi:hypothetical protein AB0L75_40410 [Streptomyces sp. NPDC052101]|uniref:hypothetical protein n=1 Tax=Streptomyces sp. NPDC052101 TaxID=3155763 RepID=UPI003435A9E4
MNQLVSAQERTILALEEVNRLKDAYVTSEKARQKAVHVGSAALALLGQARAEITRLNRKIDYLESASTQPESRELNFMLSKLRKAESRERELSAQLERAERDRDRYQQIADFAARRLGFMERELNRVSARDSSGYSDSFEIDALDSFDDDVTPNKIDDVIAQLHGHLNQQYEVMQESAGTIGWDPMFAADGGRVVEARPNTGESAVRVDAAARVLSLAQQTADQYLAEAKAEADLIVEGAQKRANEIEGRANRDNSEI